MTWFQAERFLAKVKAEKILSVFGEKVDALWIDARCPQHEASELCRRRSPGNAKVTFLLSACHPSPID
jgi:hypothetical protein